jgi:CHAT domain-containing protein
MAVDEIIDRYVAGEFSGAELQHVQTYFFESDARREKLRFALALKEQKSRRNSTAKSHHRRSLRYLAVAASIVVLLGIGFIAWRALRPQPDLNDGLVALQQAFREERPIEGRLSDFNYVPLPNQRGGSARVDYTERDLAGALLLKAVRDRPTAAAHHAAAKYYLMNHQFPEAEKEFTAALELDPQSAKIHNDFGAALLEEGQRQTTEPGSGKQLELYGRSLEQIQKALELDNSLLEALFNRALVFQFMKPSDQAKEAWRQYLQKDGNSQWADEARRNLKLIDQQQQLGASTGNDHIKTFVQALKNSDNVAAWKVMSGTYTSAGNEITNHFIDCLFDLEPSGGCLDPASTLAGLTYIAKLEQDRNGDRFTSDLVNYYKRAGPRLQPTLADARYYMRTAYASFQKSSFPEAIREYAKAKANYEQADDRTGLAFVEYRLAHCYVLLPNPQRALQAFSNLLTLAERDQYRWLAAQCLSGLAHASGDSSEYSNAIRFGAEALTKLEQVGDTNGVLKCLTQLADFNLAINQIPAALGYLSRSLALADAASEPKQIWTILTEIGFSMTSLKQWAAALFYHKEALRIAKTLGIPLLISRSSAYVGTSYAEMRLYREAVNEAMQAFEIGRTREDQTGKEMMAQASLELGDIYRKAGKCDEALTHYDHSLRLYDDLKFYYYSYVAHKGKLRCFLASANNQATHDELFTVLNLSESYRNKITEEMQRNSFFDAEQEVYDVAIDYEFSVEKDYVKALEYSEQSRARSLLDLLERGARLRARGRDRSVNSRLAAESLTASEIQAGIPEATQIVQYAVLNDKLLCWVITKTNIWHAEVAVSNELLYNRVNTFLATLTQRPSSNDYERRNATALFNLLIAPIQEHLDPSKTLVIIPDKMLNYVPYAALTSPVSSNYLIEDYKLAVASSGTLVVKLSEQARRRTEGVNEQLVSIGNPLFDRNVFASLRDLPASADESEAIAKLYHDPVVLVHTGATEQAVKQHLEKAAVAHFATHFVVNEGSEMLSGFPLTPDRSHNTATDASDGFLQSFEIARLNLRRTRLVVLSACQTGIEKQYGGEGAISATRPFFVAGVPTVVASLWPIDSNAAEDLMIKFHRHQRDRMPVAKALQQAQLELIRGDANYRHPYYWAPFVAIGGLADH